MRQLMILCLVLGVGALAACTGSQVWRASSPSSTPVLVLENRTPQMIGHVVYRRGGADWHLDKELLPVPLDPEKEAGVLIEDLGGCGPIDLMVVSVEEVEGVTLQTHTSIINGIDPCNPRFNPLTLDGVKLTLLDPD